MRSRHINGNDSGSLGRVHNEIQMMSLADFPKSGKGHSGSADIGSMDRDDGLCLWADQRLHLLQEHGAVLAAGNPVTGDPTGC